MKRNETQNRAKKDQELQHESVREVIMLFI